jgi:hypothetical protein
LWAIGDVTGIWPLTQVGKYQATSGKRRRCSPRPTKPVGSAGATTR